MALRNPDEDIWPVVVAVLALVRRRMGADGMLCECLVFVCDGPALVADPEFIFVFVGYIVVVVDCRI